MMAEGASGRFSDGPVAQPEGAGKGLWLSATTRRARRLDRRPKFRSGIWAAEAMPQVGVPSPVPRRAMTAQCRFQNYQVINDLVCRKAGCSE